MCWEDSIFFPLIFFIYIYILVSNTPTIAKMKFSTAVVAAAAVAAPAVAEYTNSTVTDIHTTVVTITSCSDNKCTEVPVTTGLTTVTEEDTIYTTYCPLTDVTTYTASDIHTTVVTITSCSDDKCHEHEVTTGLTTVTEEDTIYTTYCPISTSAAPVETTTPTTAAPVETTPTTAAPVKSSTTTPATVAPVESTTSASPSTVAEVSTAANAANAFAAPAVGAALLAGLSFLY